MNDLSEKPDFWFTEHNLDGDAGFCMRVKEHIFHEQSDYQRIDILDTYAYGRVMTLDGLVMLTERDEFIYHEMMAHIPIFSHPDPRRVLIIGGGDGGTLREVLKHPDVEQCVMVEIDKAVVEASRRFLPTLASALDHPKARLYFENGIDFVNKADEGSFDVILIDCTDPTGPAEALFELPFYHACLRLLGRDGIICQQTESPLLMPELIRSVHQKLRQAGFAITKTSQAHCVSYPSGWWTFTLGSKRIDPATGFRRQDAALRSFETRYYNETLHQGCFMLPVCVEEALLEETSKFRDNNSAALGQ
ncbi:MAG: polyamine aminopropyltransferase [Mariprofundaceae bacterium]